MGKKRVRSYDSSRESVGLLESDSEDDREFCFEQNEVMSPAPSSMLSEDEIRSLVDSQLQALAELDHRLREDEDEQQEAEENLFLDRLESHKREVAVSNLRDKCHDDASLSLKQLERDLADELLIQDMPDVDVSEPCQEFGLISPGNSPPVEEFASDLFHR